MITHVIAFALFAALAHAGGIGSGGLGTGIGLGGVGLGIAKTAAVVDLYAPPNYEFQYAVGDPQTGDRKEQTEVRVGDLVKGQYSLAEPDGTLRVVKYTSDDINGFNAVVERIGKAVHPQVLVQKAIAVPAVAVAGGRGLGGSLGLEGGLGLGAGLGYGLGKL
ncbi:hypothetical protein NQ318_019748 [Aromia moschata]|uniref:Larval cuticle protein A2B n=1 Tax=Aromia moschata TaxID=1265417 RepID=A0AAV8XC87_9CUCU|nr:hypothetical protein NQ318_019748 [Aromia moschata]